MTDLNAQNPLELEVKNFGPIAEAKIDLRPFTVFVGPSNTGKSYLAILIYALHRFFSGGARADYFPDSFFHPLALDEKLPKKHWNRLIKSLKHTFVESPDEDSILVPEPVADLIFSFFSKSDIRNGNLADGIFRCFGTGEPKALIRKGSQGGAQVVLRKCVSEDLEPIAHKLMIYARETVLTKTIPKKMPIRIDVKNTGNEFRSQLEWVRAWAKELLSTDRPNHETLEPRIVHLIKDLSVNTLTCFASPLHQPAFYLPSSRTGIMHAQRVTVSALIERAARAGLPQPYPTPMLSGVLADFLEQLINLDTHPQDLNHDRSDLGRKIEKAILGGTVNIQKSESGYPHFTYRQKEWKDELPLLNASSMVSELAPVVLYLRHVVQPDNVLIIEEPESHLHPAMQVEFTRQLAALVRAGVRVIITTHSEWVLEELANIVRLSGLSKAERKGIAGGDVALRPEEVGAWLFQPKNRPRGSVVKEIPLDDDSGLFPSGFDEVAVALHNNWAEISSRGGANG